MDVNIKDTEQLIIISIKDTGVGIPKEKLKNIFERFERADRSTIKTSEGSGIGLSIVKQMVEALNGTIDISSVENKGTIVKIILQKDNSKDLEVTDFSIDHLSEKVKLELSDI
ncbi:ATP-binding protein [Romboutsia ilealis]|uniref:histidine kinase n=1 Tax=Romboutsia faecis TaxID=2764597 RepID=A0ABR7JSN2_9FIRM|nr:sensor histidine kinase [Romboutsia faecis]MBC5997626.1 sensor histidine kinase [Romboutsia faecis]MRN25424.1 ATP-binding protein [Romboutsia ilealis]